MVPLTWHDAVPLAALPARLHPVQHAAGARVRLLHRRHQVQDADVQQDGRGDELRPAAAGGD
eukprot:388378-Pyramimonas_sp.AAC.1